MTETEKSEKLGDSVRAVERALDILKAFTPSDHQLTASELLKRVDLSRPTLYRLLRTLENSGFVMSSGDPQRFQLGPSVAYLAHVWGSGLDIATLAQPMLRRLWDETGETVSLMLHQGGYRICVAELPSPNPLSFKRGVGHRDHVTAGASGRAILAFTPAPESYLNQGGPHIDDPEEYLRGLERVRQQGYAVSQGELIKGAVAVAVPYFFGDDKVMGSLAVFGPSVRVDKARVGEFAAMLKEEAKKLSQALGQR